MDLGYSVHAIARIAGVEHPVIAEAHNTARSCIRFERSPIFLILRLLARPQLEAKVTALRSLISAAGIRKRDHKDAGNLYRCRRSPLRFERDLVDHTVDAEGHSSRRVPKRA